MNLRSARRLRILLAAALLAGIGPALFPMAEARSRGGASVGDVVDGAVEDVARQLERMPAPTSAVGVVVADFVDLDGKSTELGRFLSDQIATRLVASPHFEVVERRHLERVLEELNLQMSDLVNPDSARQVGQFLGVGSILLGTISPLDDEIRVNLRLVDVQTARALAAASVQMPALDALLEMNGNAGAGGSRKKEATAPAVRPGVLTWTYYNVPPWTGKTAPNASGLQPVRVELSSNLERYIKSGAPAPGVSADYFYAVGSGEVLIETPGTYIFDLEVYDVGVIVTIGSNTVANRNFGDARPKMYISEAGWQPIQVELFHHDGHARWELRWQRPGDLEPVPVATTLLRTRK